MPFTDNIYNNKILWLPSWFPSKEYPQNGDFILRQADAVSRIIALSILFVNSSKKIKTKESLRKNVGGNLRINEFFFPNKGLLNFLLYFHFYRKEFKSLIRNASLPSIVHVHVCYKAGLFALWLKWRFGIPYAITEHWTYFTHGRKDNYLKDSLLKKWLIRLIFNNSSFVLPVSRNLESQLNCFFPKIRSIVIPNVVDSKLFFFPNIKRASTSFHFVHISSLSPIKNPIIIIKVFNRLLLKFENINLDIVGPLNQCFLDEFEDGQYGNDSVVLCGEKEHQDVAKILQQSNAFVLFSNYETQSCVSIEALCCGLPVISSRLPCIEEFINEENGILVPPGDENALYLAMEDMILNYSRYDREKISQQAQAKYNPEVVGRQIVEVYEKVLSKKSGK